MCRDSDFSSFERAAYERIVARRAETVGQIRGLSADFAEIVSANALVAIDDEHDPEGASTAFERAHVAALLAQAEDRLTQLDRALERLRQGDYGQCLSCGKRIPAERLEVRPGTSVCVRCAAARSRRPGR